MDIGDKEYHACLEEASQLVCRPGVAGSYESCVLFEFILLSLKTCVTGNLSCGKASSLGQSGKGAKRLLVSTLVSTAGLAVGVEAVPLLLTASGKWRLPGPLSLKLSISIELQQY